LRNANGTFYKEGGDVGSYNDVGVGEGRVADEARETKRDSLEKNAELTSITSEPNHLPATEEVNKKGSCILRIRVQVNFKPTCFIPSITHLLNIVRAIMTVSTKLNVCQSLTKP
jgi:hypothetical protein